MSNFQIPKNLAFPALMLAGGAFQAAVGHFVTRKVTPSITVGQATLGRAQGIFLATSALYTLIGTAAMNYGAKYALEHGFSILVPKSWSAVAFVAQAILVGGAIYGAGKIESSEVKAYKKLADAWEQLDAPLDGRIQEALEQQDSPLFTAVVVEIAAAKQALEEVIEARNVLTQGTVVEAEVQEQAARLALYTEKKAELEGKLATIHYSGLVNAWKHLDAPLDARIQEALGQEDRQLLTDLVAEIAGAKQALEEVIEARNALPEGAVIEAEGLEARLAVYAEKKIELEGTLREIAYRSLVNAWQQLDTPLDARIQEAEEDSPLLTDVVAEIAAAEQALKEVIAARNALPEGAVTEAEVQAQAARLAVYEGKKGELSEELMNSSLSFS